MSESEDIVIVKTEADTSGGSAGSHDAGTGQPARSGSPLDTRATLISSTDPQIRSFAASPTTTAGSTSSVAGTGAKDAITPQTLALFESVITGNRSIFAHLPAQKRAQLSWGIDINWQDRQTGRTPLTLALAEGEWDIAVELLSFGADPDLLDGAHAAPRELASPMCRMILQFFSWSTQKQSADWSVGKEAVLRELLSNRDSVDGHTMLTWAAGRRHDKLACMLIGAGAGFGLASARGEGPLEEACRTGSLSLVIFMLDAWPDLVTTHVGRAYFRLALRAAIEAKRPAVVSEMLSAFRRIYRADGKPPVAEDMLDLKEVIPRDRLCEEQAYQVFFGSQTTTTFVFATALPRTRDDCLLTPDECELLKLHEMEMLAVKKGYAKVLEVIEANYKLASGIPRATAAPARLRAGDAGDASTGLSGSEPIPEPFSASTPESSQSQ